MDNILIINKIKEFVGELYVNFDANTNILTFCNIDGVKIFINDESFDKMLYVNMLIYDFFVDELKIKDIYIIRDILMDYSINKLRISPRLIYFDYTMFT